MLLVEGTPLGIVYREKATRNRPLLSCGFVVFPLQKRHTGELMAHFEVFGRKGCLIGSVSCTWPTASSSKARIWAERRARRAEPARGGHEKCPKGISPAF